jgi:biofilm PGA synthesis N-glycosyltransferase PgaC
MINLNLVSITLLTVLLLLILTLCFLDYRKKRTLAGKPFVSFLVPCYNDADTVKETIESVYESYDASRFEIIVVNDGSTDESLRILRSLRKKRDFTLVSNKKNRGKARSLNSVCGRAKGDILFILDADVILNRGAVNEMLARLQDERVAAVSSPYRPKNRGFLASLQEVEYNMLLFIQGAHNRFSTIAIWGGCCAVKRKPFEEVHRLSENAILEDMDLALKLREAGHRVEQSFSFVESYVPSTVGAWSRQKIRWNSGTVQNIRKHYKTWLRHSLNLIFVVLFSLLSLSFTMMLVRQALLVENIFGNYKLISEATMSLLSLKAVGLYYGAILLKNLLVSLYFAVFAVPYVIPMIGRPRQIYKLLYAIPFSILYLPAYSVVCVIGIVKGIVRYRALERGERAW